MSVAIDRARLVRYGALPAVVAVALVGMYFSGLRPLQALVAPRGQREFGLLENLQNLALLGIALRAWRGAGREGSARAKHAARLLALFALFVLMEELDWGDHYYAAWSGRQILPGEKLNLHNRGDVTGWSKRIVDLSMFLGCVVAPALGSRLPERLRPWVPSGYSFWTLLVGVVAGWAAHTLEDAGWPTNRALRSNISEFRELFVYWLAWLYLGEIARRRGWLAPALHSRAGNALEPPARTGALPQHHP